MEETTENWFDRLCKKWGVSRQVGIKIFLVFACTGTSVSFVKHPIMAILYIPEPNNLLGKIAMFLLITLPVYQVLLLMFGALFGEFRFFWEFEKRTFRRIGALFKKKKS